MSCPASSPTLSGRASLPSRSQANASRRIHSWGYLRNAAAKRAKKLQLALPDGLDLMVICAEAGLSLDATLVRVSRELARSFPELAEELAIPAAEFPFLADRRAAFDNLNNRTDSEAIHALVNTLQQTAKFGTPLA